MIKTISRNHRLGRRRAVTFHYETACMIVIWSRQRHKELSLSKHIGLKTLKKKSKFTETSTTCETFDLSLRALLTGLLPGLWTVTVVGRLFETETL